MLSMDTMTEKSYAAGMNAPLAGVAEKVEQQAVLGIPTTENSLPGLDWTRTLQEVRDEKTARYQKEMQENGKYWWMRPGPNQSKFTSRPSRSSSSASTTTSPILPASQQKIEHDGPLSAAFLAERGGEASKDHKATITVGSDAISQSRQKGDMAEPETEIHADLIEHEDESDENEKEPQTDGSGEEKVEFVVPAWNLDSDTSSDGFDEKPGHPFANTGCSAIAGPAPKLEIADRDLDPATCCLSLDLTQIQRACALRLFLDLGKPTHPDGVTELRRYGLDPTQDETELQKDCEEWIGLERDLKDSKVFDGLEWDLKGVITLGRRLHDEEEAKEKARAEGVLAEQENNREALRALVGVGNHASGSSRPRVVGSDPVPTAGRIMKKKKKPVQRA